MYWYNSNMEIDAGQACVAYDQPKVKVGEWICFVYVNRVDTGYQLYFDGAPMRLSGSGSASSPTATPLGQFILGAAGIWQNRVGFHFRGKIDECLHAGPQRRRDPRLLRNGQALVPTFLRKERDAGSPRSALCPQLPPNDHLPPCTSLLQ
jgi:hypothetical protein